MAQFPVNTHRFDPYRAFKFQVVMEGKPIPGVLRVSPLRRVTEPVEHRSGGDPSNVRIAPGVTRYDPITLERGVTHDTTFEEWANLIFSVEGDAAISLATYRRDLTINLLNLQGNVVLSYRVYRAWVSEYVSLPELDAKGNSIAMETIVLQHEGWERDREVVEPTES